MEGVKKMYNDIPKSPRDDRLYRGLELSNNMKVLVISDPLTDKSAAALDVHIGKITTIKYEVLIAVIFIKPHTHGSVNLFQA